MKNKFLKLGAFALVTLALSSCIKDKAFDDGTRGIEYDASQQKIVSIELSTTDTLNSVLTSFGAISTSRTFNLVPVQLAGGIPATQDVHVVLALDSNIVNAYNTRQGTAYLNPLPSAYTVPTLSVTIPKGQSRAYVQLSIIPLSFLGKQSALGFRIVSVDGGYKIAGGYKATGVAAFGIANDFEADYNDVAIRYNYSTTPITYTAGAPIPTGYVSTTAIPTPKHLATIDATRNLLDFANLGASPNSYHYILDFSSINLTSNTDQNLPVSLDAAANAGNSLVQFITHTYNPVTKTIKLVVLYNNNGTGTGSYRLLFETLTRI